MAAAHGDPPAVARQRVRRALRKAREGTPWSQGEVAKKLGWSLSKMPRIEGGEVAVSPTDLRALLDVYGITDPQRIEQLTHDARTSRRQRYVTAPEYREHLTPELVELMQFEKQAESIRAYQPVFYPGVLQTPAVAEAVLGRWQLPVEALRVRFEARAARRRSLIERSNGPDYFLVLDEAVIKRRFAGPKATAEQLEDLVEVARRPNIHIRIVPLARGADMIGISSFIVVHLGGDRDNSVLYREHYNTDELVHEPAEVEFHRGVFESLWSISLNEEATLRAFIAEAARLRASMDQS
jgi:transcriptional regulator with XRE-family HTH domain